jgi:pilus assembly protein CpaF
VTILQALSTGHDGSMKTVHGTRATRSPAARRDAGFDGGGYYLPMRAIRVQISRASSVVAHLERLRDGIGKVVQISEVVVMEGDVITMRDVFRFIRTGPRRQILDRLGELGLPLPAEIV